MWVALQAESLEAGVWVKEDYLTMQKHCCSLLQTVLLLWSVAVDRKAVVAAEAVFSMCPSSTGCY